MGGGRAHRAGAPALYERYLTENIRYRLGSEELSGVAAFFERGHAAGLFRERARLRLYEQATSRRARRRVSRRRPARAHSVDTLLADAAAGARLSPEDGLRLYAEAPTLELGAAADARRRALHAGNEVTYIIDRNVNYTNVCVTRCKFCNFYRPPTHKTEGYVLSREELAQEIPGDRRPGRRADPPAGRPQPEPAARLVRGSLPLDEGEFPARDPRPVARGDPLHRRARGMPIRAVIERLVAAGLDSIPGGGAEILDDEIRYAISPLKCTTDVWLEVMRQGHALGLRTTATMVFGFGEKPRHIINHFERLRALQDQTAGLHGVHLLAVPGRGHAPQAARRHDGHALPARVRARAPLPRQLSEPAGLVADDGSGGRAGRR